MRRPNAEGKIMLKCVESRASFITVRETVHLVKFIGKGCSICFSSAYVTLLNTTGYKVQSTPDNSNLQGKSKKRKRFELSGVPIFPELEK